LSAQPIDTLTPREREILVLIAEGRSIVEIAHRLHRSQKTIESHRLALGRKLKVSNRVELAKIAYEHGLVRIGGSASGGARQPAGPAEPEPSLLAFVNDTIADATGGQLLERFCVAASTLPGVEIAAICTADPTALELDDPTRRVVMAIARRGKPGQPMRYDASKTAFSRAMQMGECLIAEGLVAAFPDDPWMRELGAESYLGVLLRDERGEAVGGLGLIGLEAMRETEALRALAGFFAPRLVAALKMIQQINALRAQIDRLESENAAANADPAGFMIDAPHHPSTSRALAEVSLRVQPLAGVGFLRGLLDAMSEVFGVPHGGLCIQDHPAEPTWLRSVLMRLDGQYADPIRYSIEHAPCRRVLQDGHHYIPRDAAAVFPQDDWLVANDIDSYVGIRLPGPGDRVMGLLWLGSDEPIEDAEPIRTVASYYAPRLGAELYNLMQVENLMQERDRLEAALEQEAT